MAEETSAPVTLSEKIRRAREFTHEVGGFKFMLRRPTEVEFFDVFVGTGSSGRFLPWVIGWDSDKKSTTHVKESDVLVGGNPHPLEFNAKVRDEWLADRSDLFGPLITAMFDEFTKYNERRRELEKNSQAG